MNDAARIAWLEDEIERLKEASSGKTYISQPYADELGRQWDEMNERAEKAEADKHKLVELLAVTERVENKLRQRAERAEDEIMRLREALEFYAKSSRVDGRT